jgi:hypothetical protein
MPSAVRLREYFSAEALRPLAKRSKDANRSRRLLSLAAVRDAVPLIPKRRAAGRRWRSASKTAESPSRRAHLYARARTPATPHKLRELRQSDNVNCFGRPDFYWEESGFTARAAIRSSRRRRSLISPAGFEPLLRKAEERLPFGRIAFVSYRDGVVAVLFGLPWGQCGKIEIE